MNIVLFFIVAASAGAAIFVAGQPLREPFTEFYLLGPDGKAEGYQTSVVSGGNINVNLGIINREEETVTYRVEVFIGEQQAKVVGPITLKHEEKWEERVNFRPQHAGNHQKVEYRLYRSWDSSPYLVLYLWVDVG